MHNIDTVWHGSMSDPVISNKDGLGLSVNSAPLEFFSHVNQSVSQKTFMPNPSVTENCLKRHSHVNSPL